MEQVTSVFIADSAEDFCLGLSAALQRSEGFQVVGTANDGEQAIRLIAEKKPAYSDFPFHCPERPGSDSS